MRSISLYLAVQVNRFTVDMATTIRWQVLWASSRPSFPSIRTLTTAFGGSGVGGRCWLILNLSLLISLFLKSSSPYLLVSLLKMHPHIDPLHRHCAQGAAVLCRCFAVRRARNCRRFNLLFSRSPDSWFSSGNNCNGSTTRSSASSPTRKSHASLNSTETLI